MSAKDGKGAAAPDSSYQVHTIWPKPHDAAEAALVVGHPVTDLEHRDRLGHRVGERAAGRARARGRS